MVLNTPLDSPHLPQDNGLAEMTVQTTQESKDPYLALLGHRAALLAWCQLSPAELLMGRRLRTTVPHITKHFTPKRSHFSRTLRIRTRPTRRNNSIVSGNFPITRWYWCLSHRKSQQMASGQIQRWALTLGAYNYLKARKTPSGCPELPTHEKDPPRPAEMVHLLEHLNTSPVSSTQIRAGTIDDTVLPWIWNAPKHGVVSWGLTKHHCNEW